MSRYVRRGGIPHPHLSTQQDCQLGLPVVGVRLSRYVRRGDTSPTPIYPTRLPAWTACSTDEIEQICEEGGYLTHTSTQQDCQLGLPVVRMRLSNYVRRQDTSPAPIYPTRLPACIACSTGEIEQICEEGGYLTHTYLPNKIASLDCL